MKTGRINQRAGPKGRFVCAPRDIAKKRTGGTTRVRANGTRVKCIQQTGQIVRNNNTKLVTKNTIYRTCITDNGNGKKKNKNIDAPTALSQLLFESASVCGL